jgi:hypothetical protein
MNANTSDLAYFLCGGTGINIGVALKKGTHTDNNKNAFMIGMDSSDRNSSHDMFPIEQMVMSDDPERKAQGSGKVKATNYPLAEQFLKGVLAKHKPRPFNIIVCSTGGGTGSMLGFVLARMLWEQDQLVVMCFINDKTSQVEEINVVNSYRSYASLTNASSLNRVVPYMEFDNTPDTNRGDANRAIVDKLDVASLFLTNANGEQDHSDLKNLLNFSKHYGVPPSMSRIRFYDEKGVAEYQGKVPVAVSSLFDSSDSIVGRFNGTVIRSTGVFAAGVKRPSDASELHMVLDHGEALKELEKHIEAMENRKNETQQTYVAPKDLSQGADAKGFFM